MSVTSPDAAALRRAAGPAKAAVQVAPLGLSLSLFFAITFLLCALGAFVPGLATFHLLQAVYPELDWAEPATIAAGTIFAFACGWYTALVWGPLYNLFAKRGA